MIGQLVTAPYGYSLPKLFADISVKEHTHIHKTYKLLQYRYSSMVTYY